MVRNPQVTSFNIVALGPPKSGKTVYLATLHQVIGAQSLATGVSFTTSPTERARLQEIYDQVVSPDHDWPDSTEPGRPMRETKFTCTVEWTSAGSLIHTQSRRFRFPIFEITYIDYAGEWIPGAHTTDPELFADFAGRLASAHAVLGMIDGKRLLQFLKGAEEGRAFFHDDLRPIVELVRDNKAPVHFVITKWDLLEGEYSLADIGTRLLASEGTGFRELVESRTGVRGWGRPPVGNVRLIPVSSVGDFAKLGPDWEVAKVRDVQPKQVNVEMPLVAAVLDICGMAMRILRMQAEQRAGAQGREPDRNKSTSDVKVSLGLHGVTVSLSAVLAFTLSVGRTASGHVGRPAARLARSMRREYRRVRTGGITVVKSEEAGLLYVANAFKQQMTRFEDSPSHSGSVLANAE